VLKALDVALSAKWRHRSWKARFIGFDPELFLLRQQFPVLIKRRLCGGLEQVSAECDIHARIHLDELCMSRFKAGGSSFQNFCLEIGENPFASPDIGDAIGDLVVLAYCLSHARAKTAL